MSVNFSNERIKLEDIKGENHERETIVEKINIFNNELVVDKILDFEARIKKMDYQIKDGGVEIAGVIKIDFLYTGFDYEEESFIDNFSDEIEFDNYLIVTEAEKDLECYLDYDLIEEKFELLNDNEIKVEFCIEEFVKVFEYQEVEIIKNISGINAELLDRERVNFENLIEANQKDLKVEEQLEITEEVDKILAVRVNLDNKYTERVDNIIKLKGNLKSEIIYKNEQGLNYKEVGMDFSEEICSLVNINKINIESDIIITEINHDLKNHNNISIDVALDIRYKVTELKETSVIFAINSDKFELEKEEIKIEEIIGQDEISKDIRKNLVVPELKADINQIIYEKVNLSPTIANLEEGGVLIKQDVAGEVIYSSNQNDKEEIITFNNNFEISSFISIPDAKEGMSSYTELMINNLKSELLNSRTVEINFSIKKSARVKEFRTLNLITDIIKVAPIVYVSEEERPSFIVYIVKKDDNLNKVAKKYKVKAEDLVAENKDIKQGKIKPGDKLIIPKKIINTN